MNYATDFPLVFLFGMLTVSDKAFSRLSDEDQAIVKRVMRDTFAELDKQNAKDEQGARQALIQNGMEFVQLSEDDKIAWRQLADDALKELREDDVYPVEVYQKLVNRLEALRAE